MPAIRVRRVASIAIALVVTTVAMGCGGSAKRTTPVPTQTLEAAARAAAIAGVTTTEPDEECAQRLTARLVHRVYAGVSRCKRIVARSSTSPNFDANVIAAKVAGDRAVARVVVKN